MPMLYFLIFSTLSIFQPDQAVNCLRENKCPKTIDETIISISKRQYCGCQYPTSKAKIDNSIQRIPSYSFYGATIQELKLHSHIQYIDEGAFGNCSINLNFSVMTNLQVIGDGSFYLSKIPSVLILPNNLEIIGSYAFANVTAITKSIINAKTIKSHAFFGCYNMYAEKIQIASSGSIHDHAFYDCYQLNGTLIINKSYDKDINNNLIYSNLGVSSFQNSGIRILKLPQINEIGSYCFYNCCQLIKCSIISIEKIGHSAFELNPNANIKIKNRKFNDIKILNKYNQNMFSKTTDIYTEQGKCGDNIDYKIYNYYQYINIEGSGPMYDNFDSFQYYKYYVTQVEFYGSITSIGSYSFKRLSNLQSITFHTDSITHIGEHAFYYCLNLSNIHFPRQLISIDNYAFYNCEKLRDLMFPDKLVSIGDYAFAFCSNVRWVQILDNVTNIGVNVFKNCSSLTNIEIGIGLANTDIETFLPSNYSNNINVRFYTRNPDYDTDSYGLYLKNPYTLIRGINCENYFATGYKTIHIGEKACKNLNKIEYLAITDKVQTIGPYAFYNCSNLKKVILNYNLSYIGHHAFFKCESLTSIIIPENVYNIGSNAFVYTSLESVVILSNNISFYNGFSHKYSHVKMSITYIGNKTSSINSIMQIENNILYYPFYYDQINNIKNINRCVFLGICGENLKWLFNADTKTIYIYGYGDMYDYNSSSETPWNIFKPFIEKVITTHSVNSIGNNSFRNCQNLKYVEINGNVKYIGSHSFSSCPIFNIILYDNFPQKHIECSSTAFVENEQSFFVFSRSQNRFCDFRIKSNNFSLIPNISLYKPDLTKTAEYYYLITVASNETKSKTLFNNFTRIKADTEIFVLYTHYFSIDYEYNSSTPIRAINNSIYDFNHGSIFLNLDNSDNFTIILNKNERQRLGITGNGKIIFTQRISNSNITFIEDCSINGQLKLIIPDEISNIYFNYYVNLYLESSLIIEHENKKGIINVTCNKIVVKPKSNSIISNMTIKDYIKVHQYSKVKLENVVFELDSIVYFDIYNYHNIGFDSIYIGDNCNHPKSFIFSKNNKDNSMHSNPIYDTDYVLISGFTNPNDCQKWLDVIDLDHSGFDSKKCQDSQKIVIRASKKGLRIKNHFGINEKIGLGLGCVGFPVLICAIIYHCVLAFKKSQVENSNSLSD